MTNHALEIERVCSRGQKEAFLKVPWHVYRDDPHWIPPLLMERRDHINPAKNPLFQHAEVAFFIAKRDGRAVGRIAAIKNQDHLDLYDDATAQFGLIDAIDDSTVFQELLKAAETWAQDKGLTRILGPFSLSINEESGLLVEGFDSPPQFLMGHARPYFAQHLEKLGYQKAMDLLAYRFDMSAPLPKLMPRMIERAEKKQGLKTRWLDEPRFNQDLQSIMDIFNDAWSDNWGFLPFKEADIAHMAKGMRQIIEPGYVAISELDGRPVSMAVCFPNLNEVIADLNGRLLPFGWAKILWRLKVKTPKTGRMALMGVRKEFHDTTLGAVLAFSVMEKTRIYARGKGIQEGELSWILETNKPVRNIIESFESRIEKVYRIYEKSLS